MRQPPSIAIVGAGPAGLTAACILQKHGWAATVFEADTAAASRDQGGTLDLHADTGQIALERAGLLPAFLAIARHEDQQNRLLDHRSGATLAQDGPAPGEGERPEIDRRALRDLLLEPLAAETVRWGRRLKEIATGSGGRHRLRFEDGGSESFDLVIGADGAWSRVRPALVDAQPVYTGVTFVELWIDDADARQPTLSQMVGHGTMFALHAGHGIVAQRNGGGHIRVYAVLHTSPDESARTGIPLAGITRADLLRRFDGWFPALLDLIAKADAIAAVRPIVALPPRLRWPPRRGLTLVGDAAHVMPPVGLGVNLAMLDAADLAETLISAGDWVEAVTRFEEAMLDRAAPLAEEALIGFAEMFGPDAPRAMLEHMRTRRD